MFDRKWTAYFRPHPSAATPTLFRLVFAAVSGAALSLSYTGLYLSVYSWVCVGVLLVVLFGARPRVAFACGFVHGLSFVLSSVPWIATVLAVHGGLSRAGGWGVLVLIAGAWGILTGTFAWSVQRISQRSVMLACIAAPFLWVTFEFVRAHLPEISFPWNLLGYPAASSIALIQLTSVTGIYGLSFVVASFNALLAWTDVGLRPAPKYRVGALAGAAAIILLIMLTGARFVPNAEAQHYARAVQTNFPESDSYESNWFQAHQGEMDEIERYSVAPSKNHPDLLIWPEAPAPFSFEDPRFAAIASTLAQRFEGPFLAGVIEWRPAPTSSDKSDHTSLVPYNSAILLNAQGQRIFTYDKIHLVPFGEYEPFPLIHAVVTSVSGEVGGFHKGSSYVIGHLQDDYTFGTFICYEAIYPGEIREFAAKGAELYINISNDGWFGHSAAAEQHLRMARVRAVENRRWLLRVTNNGITAVIDPYGRISRALPRDVRAAADLPYDFRTDETIYTRFGDWFAWMCVIVSIILLAGTFRKGNTASEELLIPIHAPQTLVTASHSLSRMQTAIAGKRNDS